MLDRFALLHNVIYYTGLLNSVFNYFHWLSNLNVSNTSKDFRNERVTTPLISYIIIIIIIFIAIL